MANPINDGGSAFPIIPPQDEHGIGSAPGYPFPDTGMSLRDWFAGQALIGAIGLLKGMEGEESGAEIRAAIARSAYLQADAMLAAREVSP